VELEVAQGQHEPWHPGRCAKLTVDGLVVGHAGELHPKVLTELGLPPRTSAMELDLDALLPTRDLPIQGPLVSTFPVATQDVALVVDDQVPAEAVQTALTRGAGVLLESIRLFDVYQGERIGEGKKSLAFSLRFRAADRTLTVEEATEARDAAVNLATEQTGATLRA
jgi:phenylalanyl-tRNA synthetase beta chain